MADRIHSLLDSLAWHKKYGPRAPRVGDWAPDFELRDVEGWKPLRLSGIRGQNPVALIFGSFT